MQLKLKTSFYYVLRIPFAIDHIYSSVYPTVLQQKFLSLTQGKLNQGSVRLLRVFWFWSYLVHLVVDLSLFLASQLPFEILHSEVLLGPVKEE